VKYKIQGVSGAQLTILHQSWMNVNVTISGFSSWNDGSWRDDQVLTRYLSRHPLLDNSLFMEASDLIKADRR
jgi:hypothetical protein